MSFPGPDSEGLLGNFFFAGGSCNNRSWEKILCFTPPAQAGPQDGSPKMPASVYFFEANLLCTDTTERSDRQ